MTSSIFYSLPVPVVLNQIGTQLDSASILSLRSTCKEGFHLADELIKKNWDALNPEFGYLPALIKSEPTDGSKCLCLFKAVLKSVKHDGAKHDGVLPITHREIRSLQTTTFPQQKNTYQALYCSANKQLIPISAQSYEELNIWAKTAEVTDLFQKTKTLKLQVCFSQHLTSAIKDLKNLAVLYIEGNNLSGLPMEIGLLDRLEQLMLSTNQLTELPETIGNLKRLKSLNVSNNKISALPSSIGELKALTSLNVAVNQLQSLPDEIGNLSRLTTLFANVNVIAAIPSAIGNLTALQTAFLQYNRIEELPKEMAQLTKLHTLNLSDNQLEEDPTAMFTALPNLKKLYLEQNPYQKQGPLAKRQKL